MLVRHRNMGQRLSLRQAGCVCLNSVQGTGALPDDSKSHSKITPNVSQMLKLWNLKAEVENQSTRDITWPTDGFAWLLLGSFFNIQINWNLFFLILGNGFLSFFSPFLKNDFYFFQYAWFTVFCQFSTVQQNDPIIHRNIFFFLTLSSMHHM